VFQAQSVLMPYVVGIVLSVGVAFLARSVGFDRDRAFYPTVMIVIASYYVLFAAMGDSVETVLLESIVMIGFAIAAVAGFKSSSWMRWLATACLMSCTARSWKMPGCRFGGQPFVSPTISALQPACQAPKTRA
jgi:hypothetical protein